jgi:hypothetical protein
VPLGEKRNFLAQAATGDIIVHFDDDAHYGPQYVERMLEALRGHDLASLSAWYTYSPRHRFLGFWDVLTPADYHYHVRDNFDPALVPYDRIASGAQSWAHGFSFVYRKALWERVRFQEVGTDEIGDFARRAFEHGWRGRAIADADAMALWVVGAQKDAVAYPQYVLPHHLGAKLFGAEMTFYRNAMARRGSAGGEGTGPSRDREPTESAPVRVPLMGAYASSEAAGL